MVLLAGLALAGTAEAHTQVKVSTASGNSCNSATGYSEVPLVPLDAFACVSPNGGSGASDKVRVGLGHP